MGFFSKLKQNFNHGGVTLAVVTPESANEADDSFPVDITITNTGTEQRTVTVVSAILQEHTEDTYDRDESSSTYKELSRADDTNPFTLQPGESRQVRLSVPLNIGKLMQQQLPDNPAVKAFAGVLGGVQKVMDMADTSERRHYVDVTANVEGIAMDPSHRATIKLFKPGTTGASFKIGN